MKKLFNDNRIRLYKRDKNSGNIGNVKNEAISLCRGKYILELDHDDEITNNLLEDSVKIFDEDKDVGFIYGDFINIYENNNNFFYGDFISLGYGGYYTQKYNNKWVNVYITPNINNITMSYLVAMPNHPRIWRKSVLDKLENYSEYLPICDDYEILLKTCINTKIVKICDMKYIQYMNDNNNNFSLIRNKEINRIGPKFISPIFYEKFKIHENMKLMDCYENETYIKNHSPIWKRKNYQHKFLNERVNLNYDKIYCILGHKNICKIKEFYENKKNDFIVLDNCLDIEDLQKLLDEENLDRVKCYVLRNCNEYELIKYFHLMYKYTENYEIIVTNFVSRDNLINCMININNYQNYLEIGIEYGYTFKEIDIYEKIGVDPDPKYNDDNIIMKSSDDFFKDNNINFDCIFIDGMHQSEYVIKDLNNSINVLNDNGMIIIDDILPLNEIEQQKIPNKFYYENDILKYKNPWTGDVWKVIYELLLNYSEYIEEFKYYENNNYRGIFTLKIKNKFYIEKINNYDYEKDFNNYICKLKGKSRILFTSISDRPILSDKTYPQLIKYCNKHNYDYKFIDKSLDISRHISWSKILFIKQMIIEKEYDYYIIIDDDIYITNLEIKIEDIINKYPFENILISKDVFSYQNNLYCCNAGIFICKKNNTVLKYLDDIYELDNQIKCDLWENSAMDYYHKNIDDSILKIIDINILQSQYRDTFVPYDLQWKKIIFVLIYVECHYQID